MKPSTTSVVATSVVLGTATVAIICIALPFVALAFVLNIPAALTKGAPYQPREL